MKNGIGVMLDDVLAAGYTLIVMAVGQRVLAALSDARPRPLRAHRGSRASTPSQTQRQVFYDGWVVRLSPGKAKRARSVNAHFGSTLPLDAKIAPLRAPVRGARACRRCSASRRSQHPATLDAALAARGYVAFDPTLVQVAPLGRPPDVARRDGDATSTLTTPSLAGVRRRGRRDARLDRRAARRALERLAQHAAADASRCSRRSTARRSASGRSRSTATSPACSTSSTAEAARGRGIATRIVERLLAWAWEHGATHAYLQVEARQRAALRDLRSGSASSPPTRITTADGRAHAQ